MKRVSTGIMILLMNIVFMLPVLSQDTAQEIPDSLHKLLLSADPYRSREICLELATFWQIRNMDSLLYYTDQLEKYLIKQYDPHIDAHVKKFKSYLSERNLESERALKYAFASFILFERLNDKIEMGWVTTSIARNYYQLGDLAAATEHDLKALEYFSAMNFEKGIAEVYNDLGRISYQTGTKDKAYDYFSEALALYKKLGSDYPSYKIYNNLGIIALEHNDVEEAIRCFTIAEDGYTQLEDYQRLGIVYGNLALCYEAMHNRKKAMDYSRKALQHSNSIGDKFGIITGNINMGSFYRMEGKFDSAMDHFNLALELSLDNKVRNMEASIYDELEDFYLDQQDYKMAYRSRTLQDSVKNILMDDESRQRLEDMNLLYHLKQEEKEINQLRADQILQNRRNKALVMAIFLIMIVVVIIVTGYLQIRQQKKLLSEKNKLLRDSEQNLKEVIEEKNKVFSIVAHDLRSPVAAITGFSELLSMNYDDINEEKRKEYMSYILDGSFRAMSLLENLLFWARTQMDLIEVKKRKIDVSSLISEGTSPLFSSLKQKNIDLSIQIEEDFPLTVDNEMIKAVIRNLVSNAIKFSFAGSRITVIAHMLKEEKCISVVDTGTGMDENQIKNLFSARTVKTKDGTNQEKGSGLGLIISLDFTKKNGGYLSVESETGKGSTFRICFSGKLT